MTTGTSTPDYKALTGAPQYTVVGAFQEPDDPQQATTMALTTTCRRAVHP